MSKDGSWLLWTYLSYCFLDNCTFLFEWNNCTKLLKSKAPIVQSLANQKTSTIRNISQKCPVSTPLVTTWMQDICYRHWKSYLKKAYPKGSLPLSLDLEKDTYYD
jgi:hypothetical protein